MTQSQNRRNSTIFNFVVQLILCLQINLLSLHLYLLTEYKNFKNYKLWACFCIHTSMFFILLSTFIHLGTVILLAHNILLAFLLLLILISIAQLLFKVYSLFLNTNLSKVFKFKLLFTFIYWRIMVFLALTTIYFGCSQIIFSEHFQLVIVIVSLFHLVFVN